MNESVQPQPPKLVREPKFIRCFSCCRSAGDCMVMGSATSYQQPAPASIQLEKQLAAIEAELQKQREVRKLYKMQLERTRDYLRNCLQIAQDNGFLDIFTGNIRDKPQESQSLLPPHAINSLVSSPRGPQSTAQPHPHTSLAALIAQAKLLGWYIEPDELELQEVVAQGTTADVYRGTWRGLDVAVKCIFPNLFETNEHMLGFFVQEVETLSRQRHPFVLQLMGACLEPPSHGCIVTEFLSTTLKIWLHGPGSRRKERMVPLPPLEDRLQMALEIAQAMQYLHEQKPAKVIHRDLKPSNIFLDDDMHVRIADFGHARFLNDGEKALTGETGTYVYMAPEVVRCGPYDEKSDVYSYGVILNELITGEHPYIETDYGPSRIAMEVANNGLRPALPMHDAEKLKELLELIRNSWDEDAAIRPSFATITCILRSIRKRLADAQ
ncbi:serine/threonine-protein kinase STY17-like [Coffea arabica]|uniref:Serine/threonine-protein kinase STY17-like n=1 Tax=Coffea arabica TaxID=13443 RepID=A0A6P6U2W2_COFAR